MTDQATRLKPPPMVRASSRQAAPETRPRISVHNLEALFGKQRAVRDVSIDFQDGQVTAVIGPSGCGKSTLLRCLNRMHETVPLASVNGGFNFVDKDGREVRTSAGMNCWAIKECAKVG